MGRRLVHAPLALTLVSISLIKLCKFGVLFGVVKLRRVVFGALISTVCVLFVVSVFLPFLSASWVGPMCSSMGGTVRFWSFKGAYGSFGWRLGLRFSEHFFSDYWQGIGSVWSGGRALKLLLFAQVLTVLFAVLSLVIRRFTFGGLFWSVVFSLGTVCEMLFFSRDMKGPYASWDTMFDAGFALASVSAILFFAVFVAYVVSTRKR